jgi:hypothetical protein
VDGWTTLCEPTAVDRSDCREVETTCEVRLAVMLSCFRPQTSSSRQLARVDNDLQRLIQPVSYAFRLSTSKRNAFHSMRLQLVSISPCSIISCLFLLLVTSCFLYRYVSLLTQVVHGVRLFWIVQRLQAAFSRNLVRSIYAHVLLTTFLCLCCPYPCEINCLPASQCEACTPPASSSESRPQGWYSCWYGFLEFSSVASERTDSKPCPREPRESVT